MKAVYFLSFIFISSVASANCSYFLESNLGTRSEHTNGFHYELESALSNKGYTRVRKPEMAQFNIKVTSNAKIKAKSNFFTALKDALDSDRETDYFMNFSHTTTVEVKNIEGEIINGGGSLVSQGETVDNYINFYEHIARESVKEAAQLVDNLQECRE